MAMSVRLDSKTERLVGRLARAKSRTKSEILREAIRVLAGREIASEAGSVFDSIRDLIGCADGGPDDLSERTGERFRSLLHRRTPGR